MISSSTATAPSSPQRPKHRRNQSSKSAVLKSLVSPSKARYDTSELEGHNGGMKKSQTTSGLILAQSNESTAHVLGERQSNMQSPTSSPKKGKGKADMAASAVKNTPSKAKKSKSSTNLSAMFSKINRSNKDLAQAPASRDKENTTPPTSSDGPRETPIWAQFATQKALASDANKRDGKIAIADEIARFTPTEYSPSKQRNFAATSDNPVLRPTLARRPQSAIIDGPQGLVGRISRQFSDHKTKAETRCSHESDRLSKDQDSLSTSRDSTHLERRSTDRKISGSSAEESVPKQTFSIVKRSGRVMAAVAALQGKSSKTETTKARPVLDPKIVDTEFEAMLDARNVPVPMREKMRNLTLRVKADFVRQERGAITNNIEGPLDQSTTRRPDTEQDNSTSEDGGQTTKRSRPRSRTFTFSKADKRTDDSPSKKQRSRSKTRPTSIHIPKDMRDGNSSAPSTPKNAFGRKAHRVEAPSDYINFLKENQDPTKIEVGRLHKLRILLRNETVAWVDNFVSLDGMSEIIALLHRIMAIEWREEHEDQLLHETLLCLKGLSTTANALSKLDNFADSLFPALLAMLFDEEKKGPAEYTTRTVIVNLLFTHLSSGATSTSTDAAQRARKVLAYLGEPPKPDDARPVDFVLGMQVPRPFKLWCRETTNVTREVFWIFLHHLNVVPTPKQCHTSIADAHDGTPASFATKHFPGVRPPVPAAPYIGGVEWDATTYLTAHLDLLNGVISLLPDRESRNTLRKELRASGFEKTMGSTLRTCKEKFYSGVHDGLRAWVTAAEEDEWPTSYVREGPTLEEQAKSARSSPKKAGAKKSETAPQLDVVKLDAPQLDFAIGNLTRNDDDDDGWLG